MNRFTCHFTPDEICKCGSTERHRISMFSGPDICNNCRKPIIPELEKDEAKEAREQILNNTREDCICKCEDQLRNVTVSGIPDICDYCKKFIKTK